MARAARRSLPRRRTACMRASNARIPDAIPQLSPPPPQGITTVSTSGRSSTISSAIVPLPAITPGSSKAWTKLASTPGYARSWKVCHQRSNGTLITRPPSRSIAWILVSGAVSGAITVQGMPRSRAHQARPCAMLPADAVITPRARRAGSICAIAFAAPRILNEPIGWRFSSLSQISARCAGDIQPHERRADRYPCDALAGPPDIRECRRHRRNRGLAPLTSCRSWKSSSLRTSGCTSGPCSKR